MPARVSVLVLLLLALASPGEAQQATLPAETWARRGLVIGGIAGGAAGGLLVGLLAQGLCEYECDGAFLGGMLYGGVGGAVLGGLTGLVIGAAIPRHPSVREAAPGADTLPTTRAQGAEAAPPWGGPWRLRMAVGPVRPLHNEKRETDVWISLSALRPTSARVRWGAEGGYLGTRTRREVFRIPITSSDTAVITNRWKRQLWSASLLAMRTVERGERLEGYLLASAGIYPYTEAVESTRTGDPTDFPVLPPAPQETTTPLPGVGVGGGVRWRLGGRVSLGVESRLHLILGATDDLGVGLGSLGGSVWFGR